MYFDQSIATEDYGKEFRIYVLSKFFEQVRYTVVGSYAWNNWDIELEWDFENSLKDFFSELHSDTYNAPLGHREALAKEHLSLLSKDDMNRYETIMLDQIEECKQMMDKIKCDQKQE